MEIKKSINIKLISIIVLIIIIITTVIISIKIKQNSPKYIENDTYLPGNSDVKNKVENIDELEKDRITEEVISKLNKKYGNNNFEVINMEKGSRSGLDYDVFINETYFNINITDLGLNSPSVFKSNKQSITFSQSSAFPW